MMPFYATLIFGFDVYVCRRMGWGAGGRVNQLGRSASSLKHIKLDPNDYMESCVYSAVAIRIYSKAGAGQAG